MELDADVFGGQAEPFALRGQDGLLVRSDLPTAGIPRKVQRAPVHHIDQVKTCALGPGHRQSQGKGVGAAFFQRIANYVSHP
jgi:hypothetical protein